MKNTLKYLGFLATLGTLVFITSCGGDDGGGGSIIDDDDDTGSFAVADGLYIAGISGSDTTIVIGQRLPDTAASKTQFGPEYGNVTSFPNGKKPRTSLLGALFRRFIASFDVL